MAEIYNATEEQKERARRLITDFLEQQGITKYKLAKMLNERYGRSASATNILNKLTRSSFKITELLDILDLFDYEIKLVPKSSIEGHDNSNNNG